MKKMSFWMCMFMAIGSIIGAGIFARTPLVIRLVGNGLVWGFVLAAVFVFIKTIPEVILSSALPANGAAYMHLSRLLHPSLGAIHAFNQLVLGTMNVAILSLVFAEYFKFIVPSLSVKLVAIGIAVIFTVISTFGVKASGWVQNACVVVLLITLGVFVFGGIPTVQITLADVLAPSVNMGRIWAAMGLLHGSLIGANVLMYAADEIEAPEKTIPIVFIVSTLICAFIFAAIGFVALGQMPLEAWMDKSVNLATAAQKFMSPQLLTFFIVGGPLLAVATSINAMILMFSRSHFAAARDGLFPVSISKLNQYGVPAASIWLNSIVGIIAIAAGFSLDDVVLMVSVPGLLISPIIFLSVFKLPTAYPNCYRYSFLKIPHWVACTTVVVASVLSYILGASVLAKMEAKNWIAVGGFFIVCGIYTVARWQYLKKTKGIDIIENMKQPYQPWIERENELKTLHKTA